MDTIISFHGFKIEEGGLAIASDVNTRSTLRNKYGDLLPKELLNALPEERGALCLEYSHLLASLLRAAGIVAHIKQEPTHAYVIAQIEGQKYKLDAMRLQFRETINDSNTDRESLSKHYSNEGTIFASQGKLDGAYIAFNIALEINPTNAAAWANKGVALANQGKSDEAIIAFNEALRIHPNFANVLYKKGFALYTLGKLREAVEAYDRALHVGIYDDPYDCDPYNDIAALIKLEEIIVACNKKLEINPNDADTWHTKGLALAAHEYKNEAINAYNKALEIKPNKADVLSSKKTTLFRQVIVRYVNGEIDKTIEACNRALEINLNDDDVLYDKGNDHTEQGKSRKFKKCFDYAKEYLQKR